MRSQNANDLGTPSSPLSRSRLFDRYFLSDCHSNVLLPWLGLITLAIQVKTKVNKLSVVACDVRERYLDGYRLVT